MAAEWQRAYELRDGERTGRWQWLNESGEQDKWHPGTWLEPGTICPPPEGRGQPSAGGSRDG